MKNCCICRTKVAKKNGRCFGCDQDFKLGLRDVEHMTMEEKLKKLVDDLSLNIETRLCAAQILIGVKSGISTTELIKLLIDSEYIGDTLVSLQSVGFGLKLIESVEDIRELPEGNHE